MNNEFTNMFVTLLGDFFKMFSSEIKLELSSIMPNKESIIVFLIVGFLIIGFVCKNSGSMVKTIIGTIVKISILIIAVAVILSSI